MANLKTGTTIAGSTAWHAGNDGPGSGLDADTVDGLHASAMLPGQAAATLPAPRFAGDVGVDSDSSVLWWDYTWKTLLLINSWTNYGGGYSPARLRKTMSGIVIMEGLVTGGTSTITVVPTYYRPSLHCMASSVSSGNAPCRIQVNSDGSVVPSAQAAGWFSIHMWWYGY